MRPWWIGVWIATCACSNDPRPVDIPVVSPNEHEAECQRLCTLKPGDPVCTPTHQAFCLAACRERTTGLTTACATCVLAIGDVLAGNVTTSGDKYCVMGGPADLESCGSTCDDMGTTPPAPTLDVLCDLQCGFYTQGPTPVACSDASSQDCRDACAAAIGSHGRLCAQCLAEQTSPSETCINNQCDCDPFFPISTSDCADLCDSQ